ncbi:GntR family transcriptional regulator [Desulfofundulus sp. TPOSR]|jgi:K+/H+ antiporter YhaU regulatory subunit KhtT|uniref:TrkA-C domain protein n=1 Tax=Desulfofundulus kuznetsovii (strain DSM 6115 / VKM B-1805 / 17) TaxID=760568 RepID=A0AAU8PA24_DESK7|nr:TrkA C-terminal domain-containing protein [Desulfofundulus sp. TPOSR]AEG14823.1 TrkA-C domain protein [Desulfofundulus kuznetsovii DSM 6115]NHM25713.1 GntR family transcriptional regulator [Desulfofundulus sp. TPOSR]
MESLGSHVLSRYATIAIDIATRIARGEYREGQKIFGRSTLAGKYNVSPETIRRALTLLQDTGIVHVSPGVGVVVKSQKAAEAFLAECGQRQVLRDMQERLHRLLRERDRINSEIEKLMNELLDYTFKMAGNLQRIEEIRVLPTSPLVGKSLAEAEFRAKTGSTILAIYRGGEEILSPQADTVIQAGDVLIVLAPPELKEQVYHLVNGTAAKQ